MVRSNNFFQRQWAYLRQVPILLRKDVRILVFNYDHNSHRASGLLKFMYEKVPQLQYGHGGVQIVRQPARLQDYPRIDVFFKDGSRFVVDCDQKSCDIILQTLEAVAGQIDLRKDIQHKKRVNKNWRDPADFRWAGIRKCICTVPGQAPCSDKGFPINKALYRDRKMAAQRFAEED